MTALCNTLRDEGYQAVGVPSGAEALAALRAGGFDLLLTDLAMPGMDGIVLLREALLLDPHLAGIVMTGQGTVSSAVSAMKVGAFDYVLKPFKLEALLPVLARGLHLRRLRAENTELAKRVNERTIELETVNKELEAFAYSVSHDLRTPLRAINGLAEILLKRPRGDLAPDVQRCVALIHRGSSEMDQLINSILEFSRLSHLALIRQSVDLEQLGRRVFADLSGDLQGRRVEFHVAALPKCSGDPVLLRQVLVNLISNALKFTRSRDPALIAVGVVLPAAAKGPVYFVRDNGVGFDMKQAGRLFGLFQRMYHPKEYEGTGVGLAMVRRIVERHGGEIWAEAEAETGATFYFTLRSEGDLA